MTNAELRALFKSLKKIGEKNDLEGIMEIINEILEETEPRQKTIKKVEKTKK